jgi:hypothetical protein
MVRLLSPLVRACLEGDGLAGEVLELADEVSLAMSAVGSRSRWGWAGGAGNRCGGCNVADYETFVAVQN